MSENQAFRFSYPHTYLTFTAPSQHHVPSDRVHRISRKTGDQRCSESCWYLTSQRPSVLHGSQPQAQVKDSKIAATAIDYKGLSIDDDSPFLARDCKRKVREKAEVE